MSFTTRRIGLAVLVTAALIRSDGLSLTAGAAEPAPTGKAARAPGTSVPKFKFEKGKALYLELFTETETKNTGVLAKLKSRVTIYLSCIPMAQAKDGSWAFRHKVLGMKIALDGPDPLGFGQNFDSTDRKPSSGLLATANRPLIGAEWDTTIGPEGKIRKVDNQKLLNRLAGYPLPREQARSVSSSPKLSPYFGMVLPDAKVGAAGDWTVDQKLPGVMIHGTGSGAARQAGLVTTQDKYSLGDKVDGLDLIRLESKFLKHEQGKLGGQAWPGLAGVQGKFDILEFRRSATLRFDAGKGRIESAEETCVTKTSLALEMAGQKMMSVDVTEKKTTLKAHDRDPLKK
jgi:hypothetical protein